MLSGQRLEGICNYGSCPHGGGIDGDANRAQGCIQSASESEIENRLAYNHCSTIREVVACNNMEID